MDKLLSKEWWKEAGTRAIRTFFQTLVATIGTAVVIEDVNWWVVLSASALAGILSIATSIATIPDPEKKEEKTLVTREEINKDVDEVFKNDGRE